jgi:hypothetical protein
MARTVKRNFVMAHYDKIIVVGVLLALLLSLGILINLSSSQRATESKFEADLNALSPKYEKSGETDPSLYNAAMARLAKPYVIPESGNNLLIACERVACINCQRPIPFEADVCPYCDATQPPEDGTNAGWDSDGDGMPDEWENKYGLNPLDPSDAHGDLDGDLFSNLEEFLAGTDPADPKSHPPYINYLKVEEINAIPFPFRLQSRTKMGENYSFQLNSSLESRTHFVKIGDKLNKTDFKAVSHTNRMVTIKAPGVPDRRSEVAVLIVSDGKDTLELVQGAPSPWNSFNVTFKCDKIADFEPIAVNQNESFNFDGDSYTVVKINKDPNSNTGTVVIKQKSTQKDIKVLN